jgi:hypothetical protein
MSDIKQLREMRVELLSLQERGESRITLTIDEIVDIIDDNIQLTLQHEKQSEALQACYRNHLWSL